MTAWKVSRMIPADAAALWDLLTRVEAWSDWGPSVAGAELDTPSIALGSRGRVRTALGPSLPFEVTEFEPGRRWSWSVAGVPATDHSVRAVDGGTMVSFGVPVWAPAYLPVCALALRRLDRLVT